MNITRYETSESDRNQVYYNFSLPSHCSVSSADSSFLNFVVVVVVFKETGSHCIVLVGLEFTICRSDWSWAHRGPPARSPAHSPPLIYSLSSIWSWTPLLKYLIGILKLTSSMEPLPYMPPPYLLPPTNLFFLMFS